MTRRTLMISAAAAALLLPLALSAQQPPRRGRGDATGPAGEANLQKPLLPKDDGERRILAARMRAAYS